MTYELNCWFLIPYRQIMVENVTPLILHVEEEPEDEGHVHGDDGDDDQHPAVYRHRRQLKYNLKGGLKRNLKTTGKAT